MNKDTIGLTSKASSAARAYESKRADALFIDPLASVYTEQTGNESHENMSHIEGRADVGDGEKTSCYPKISLRNKIANVALRSISLFNIGPARLIGMNVGQIFEDIAVRTRFLDDTLQKNIANVKQIVLLACGGDFRPYRLSPPDSMSSSLSDLTFYLLDVPHVLTYRKKCIAQLDVPPTTPWSVVEVPCDLSDEEWGRKLREASFDIDRPTLWLAEGFFQYLTEQQIGSLFNKVRELSSSKQTCIAFDLVSTRFQSSLRHAVAGGLFHFALDDEKEVRRIFSGLGCDDIECTSFQELGAAYGRNVSHDRSFIVNAKIRPAET
jgi:methyltransferase (TIGR00027 family)